MREIFFFFSGNLISCIDGGQGDKIREQTSQVGARRLSMVSVSRGGAAEPKSMRHHVNQHVGLSS
jgi:hypothetical protein